MSYKILSLDGGGSWAMMQVMCLQNLYGEHTTGHEVLSKFDLVAGNSGGSLVIAAMAENMKLSDILSLFKDKKIRRSIFKRYLSFWTPFYKMAGLGPRYRTEKKIESLKKLLPEVSSMDIAELPDFVKKTTGRSPHFFIPAFDYNRKRAIFFRSNLQSNGITGVLAAKLNIAGVGASPKVTITEAAHASSTAPVNFFNKTAVLSQCDSSYWDGAIAGYNNPVLAATVEATINHVPAEEIQVLSVGTGTSTLPAGDGDQSFSAKNLQLKLRYREGLFGDVRKLATSIISAPPDAASYIAYTLLNPSHASETNRYDRFIRANPQLQPILTANKRWTLPGGLTEKEFVKLFGMDMDATKEQDVKLIEKYCRKWLNDKIPNQPIRMDAHLKNLIGQPDFSSVRFIAHKYFP
ncbi:MAG TPA: patatin-like phospholipase family protein [Mucilaginibacter sp.]|jgi:predicted acylesterase/phospholipase RssA